MTERDWCLGRDAAVTSMQRGVPAPRSEVLHADDVADPGVIISEAAEQSDGLVTLLAVREPRHAPSRPSFLDRAGLAPWREANKEPIWHAAALLGDHGFVRQQRANFRTEGHFPLENAGAIVIQAAPDRARQAAELLGDEYIFAPNVALSVPAPLDEPADADWVSADDLTAADFRWPAASGIEREHQEGNLGRGVIIGVFDSGCDADHEEFTSRTVDFADITPAGEIRRPRGFATDWHGTHVSAIAAGKRIGVAPEATLLVAAVLDSESYKITLNRLIIAIDWFEERITRPSTDSKPVVLNLSLGFRPQLLRSPAERNALASLQGLLSYLVSAYDVLVVSAVGNNVPPSGPHAPAYFPDVLSVGAVSFQGDPAPFSCGGAGPCPFASEHTPHLVGYGVGVMSATERSASGTSWYGRASGTSMAAPYVSGVAALVSARTGLQGIELRTYLMSEALRLNHPSSRTGYGLARTI